MKSSFISQTNLGYLKEGILMGKNAFCVTESKINKNSPH